MNYRNSLRAIASAAIVAFSGATQATAILSTDFEGRLVSDSTASNINWIEKGVSAVSSLTAEYEYHAGVTSADVTSTLFDTSAAQGKIGVNQNLHNEGSWFVDVMFSVNDVNNIDMSDVVLDAYIFNNSGALQSVMRDLDLTVSILDTADTTLGSDTILDIYAPNGTANQPQDLTFDFSGVSLAAGNDYVLRVAASGTGPGNNAGFDNLVLNGTLNAVSAPSTIALMGLGLAAIFGRRAKVRSR